MHILKEALDFQNFVLLLLLFIEGASSSRHVLLLRAHGFSSPRPDDIVKHSAQIAGHSLLVRQQIRQFGENILVERAAVLAPGVCTFRVRINDEGDRAEFERGAEVLVSAGEFGLLLGELLDSAFFALQERGRRVLQFR